MIGWGVTAVGISASLLWNLFNLNRTNSTASRLRAEQYKSSQWTRVRSSIDTKLEDFVDASRLIVRQAQEMDADKFDGSATKLLNMLLVDAQDGLAVALDEASRSQYCEGDDWAVAANGILVGTETSWDRVLSSLNEASHAGDKDSLVTALRLLKAPVSQIQKSVLDACRVQDIALDPSKL